MPVIDINGKILDINIENPTPEQIEQLNSAFNEVYEDILKHGGKLVVQPIRNGLKILRVK